MAATTADALWMQLLALHGPWWWCGGRGWCAEHCLSGGAAGGCDVLCVSDLVEDLSAGVLRLGYIKALVCCLCKAVPACTPPVVHYTRAHVLTMNEHKEERVWGCGQEHGRAFKCHLPVH